MSSATGARIRLEFVPIGWMALGWLGFDHLQLVFEFGDSALSPQDDWYVLEGDSGRSPSGLIVHVTGADGRTTLSVANVATGAGLVRKIGTPETRGSVVLPIEGDPLDAWDRMAAYARQINAEHLPYWSVGLLHRFHPVVNSSSVVASLLWEIGIDVHDHLPSGMVFSPGTDTLLGGGRPQGLPSEWRSFDTLVGGEGDDDLRGSSDPARMDKLYGGRGDDVFHWTPGSSYIHGGQPGLPVAADGYDTVDYRGAGQIEIRPGGWQFLKRRSDYVVTFGGGGRGHGLDLLTSIEQLVIDGTTDRLAIGAQMAVIPRRLDIDIRAPTFEHNSGCLDVSAARRCLTLKALGADTVELVLGTRRRDRVWQINGVRHVIGTAHDDLIQMSPWMHVAEGGAGDDVIDARLVMPGHASQFCGYDAEIDGGAGDDILIACRGRTFARGGTGHNTFIIPRLGEAGARLGPELVVADGKPSDCLMVPQWISDEDRSAKTRLRHVKGVLDGGCDLNSRGDAVSVRADRDNDDLVLTLSGYGGHQDGAVEPCVAARAAPRATVRLLHFRNGDMGITHSAFA